MVKEEVPKQKKQYKHGIPKPSFGVAGKDPALSSSAALESGTFGSVDTLNRVWVLFLNPLESASEFKVSFSRV